VWFKETPPERVLFSPMTNALVGTLRRTPNG
jgi:hypothetical protein